MPQKPRTIHPTDAQDERLAQVPLQAAYTYAYLPTVLDDEGRVRDQPPVLNGYLWPLRADDHPSEAMAADLTALVDVGLLCRYTVDGQSYVHDPQWLTRQQATSKASSDLPPCPVHVRRFDDLVGDALGKVTEQVGALLGRSGASVSEAAVRDAVGRLVEDVTFLVDPQKAADYGEKVRSVLDKQTIARPRPPAVPDHPTGTDVWGSTTDDPGRTP